MIDTFYWNVNSTKGVISIARASSDVAALPPVLVTCARPLHVSVASAQTGNVRLFKTEAHQDPVALGCHRSRTRLRQSRNRVRRNGPTGSILGLKRTRASWVLAVAQLKGSRSTQTNLGVPVRGKDEAISIDRPNPHRHVFLL